MSESSGYRTCKCGAVYDRSEHIAEAAEISSFECAVCGETIENWSSAWVPRYRFIACPARDAEWLTTRRRSGGVSVGDRPLPVVGEVNALATLHRQRGELTRV